MYIKFLNSDIVSKCTVKPLSKNVVALSFANEIVENTGGFHLYLDEKCEHDIGGKNYETYRTVYRNDEETAKNNGYQLSNDGSVYEKPIYTVSFVAGSGGTITGVTTQTVEDYSKVIVPTPTADENYVFDKWEPEIPESGKVTFNTTYTATFTYVPTIEEVQNNKIAEMNAIQQSTIQNGLDITLSDGTVEHFTLTNHDQTSLMGLQTKVLAGDEKIPWHDSDIATGCKYYSNADMAIITEKAMAYVTWHVTYFINLRVYILALETKEEVESVEYGTYIPEEYQDEVMRDLYALA